FVLLVPLYAEAQAQEFSICSQKATEFGQSVLKKERRPFGRLAPSFPREGITCRRRRERSRRDGSATSKKCRRRRRPAFPCRRRSSSCDWPECRAKRDTGGSRQHGVRRARGCIPAYRVRRHGLRP